MRAPTPWATAYAFHTRALARDWTGFDETDPQPGWYEVRLVRRGPRVPVVIWIAQETDPETGELTAPEVLLALLDGEPVPPARVWSERVRPITWEDFEALTALRAEEAAMAATRVTLNMSDVALNLRPVGARA